jgi:hypothetical protein
MGSSQKLKGAVLISGQPLFYSYVNSCFQYIQIPSISLSLCYLNQIPYEAIYTCIGRVKHICLN